MASAAVVVARLAAVGIGQLGRIGGNGAEQLRVAAHPVGGEQARYQLAFPVAGRCADDQPGQCSVSHLLQQLDQELGEPVELEAGKGGEDEIPKRQGRCCR